MENEKSFIDKNTIVAIVVSFLIFLGWQTYMQKKYPKADVPKNTVEEGSNQNADEASLAQGTESVAIDNKDIKDGEEPPLPIKEDLLHFEGQNLSFDISSKGMGLKNIVLKAYTDRKESYIGFAELNLSEIDTARAADNKNALGPKIKTLSKQGNFSTLIRKKPIVFNIEQVDDATFKGTYEGELGQVTKTIKFDDEKFSAQVDIVATLKSGQLEPLETIIYDKIKGMDKSWFAPAYEGTDFFFVTEGEEERERQILETPFQQKYKDVSVAAVASQYFALSMVDDSSIMPTAFSELIADGDIGVGATHVYHRPVVGQKSLEISYLLFAGPKKDELLTGLNPKLSGLIDYGFFSIISRPILKMLQWFFSLLGNWGISIIFLTICIRMLLLPIAISSIKSMKKMQQIQPMLKDLRERLKDDPQKMNAETMALMKREGANPLGGCLPMLAQIPVFFALYSVLGQSIELYKSPFFFWIADLSYKDPFFVLPVCVAILYFLQMKLTPTAMDPNQKKIMTFMPLLFGVFMLSMPSGLTLYFLINTVFGIGQQYFVSRDKKAVLA